jgi:hypothetical protein
VSDTTRSPVRAGSIIRGVVSDTETPNVASTEGMTLGDSAQASRPTTSPNESGYVALRALLLEPDTRSQGGSRVPG